MSVKMKPEDAEMLRRLAAESDSDRLIDYFRSYKESQKKTENFRFWFPTVISLIALLVAILRP